MSDWQTIDSVPKDGTIILLYGKVYGGVPFAGLWDETWFTDRPWVNCVTTTRLYAHVPSHWMPLPKVPVHEMSEEEGQS